LVCVKEAGVWHVAAFRTNFVFDPSVGDGIEEQVGVVVSRFGTDRRETLR